MALSLVVFVSLLAAEAAGKFTGTWTSSSSGSNGALTIALAPGSSGEWTATSSFTYQGQEVKTLPVSVKVTGDQVEVVFSYDLGDAKLHSDMKATLTGDTLKGKYVSMDASGQPVDEGTWQATRK